MLSRRNFMLGIATVAVTTSLPALAARPKNFRVKRKYLPKNVRFRGRHPVGTIVVDARNHYLYLVTKRGRARRYGVGLGKLGLAFNGSAVIGRKAKWPRWTPTSNMIRRDPKRYRKYAGGLPGGPNNPLGARALYLFRNGRDTYFRIHGTTEPWSIGTNVSSGCIRMINEHVEDLYERVKIGARVVVI
ncbi:MAG: L,D-transpeptidase [Hyphomicrobiales bacterium]